MLALTTDHVTSSAETQDTCIPTSFGVDELNFIYSTDLIKQTRCENNLNMPSELRVREDAELRSTNLSWRYSGPIIVYDV